MLNFENIKNRINCRELLIALGIIDHDDYREMIECPVHGDTNPSFHLLNDDQYFRCFGCDREGDVIQLYAEINDTVPEIAAKEIVKLIGDEEFVPNTGDSEFKSYSYRNNDGELLYQCVRLPGKKFYYRHKENGAWINNIKGITPTLYRLEKWYSHSSPVIIVEGEKDVNTLEKVLPEYGITTNPFGAGRWREEYSSLLQGCEVYIIPDNDEQGERHACNVAESLLGIATQVKMISLTGLSESGEDVTDWLEKQEQDNKKDLIMQAIESSIPYEPKHEDMIEKAAKPIVVLPQKSRLASEFSKDIIKCMVDSKCFFRYGNDIVLMNSADSYKGSFSGFHQVSPEGFIIDCEEFLTTGSYHKNPDYKQDKSLDEYTFEPQSMAERDARRILKSKMLQDNLPSIKGVLEVPMPFINHGQLKLTQHGHSEETGYWTLDNNLNIRTIPIEEARNVIFDIFSEFCFLEHAVDQSIAIANLLTPALRLFLNGERTPIILADGNREGVGKDYLLGVSPLLYTGKYPSYAAPCATDDEWRKRIYSICLTGDNFFIVSNLKGHLSSSSLESASTSVIYTDRTLGKSVTRSIPNNAIYCFSGNGVTFSSDLERRYLQIRLEWYDEDIKKRIFKRDLYSYILESRELIISAIYSCINHWVDKEMPDGAGRMPSFDRWARMVTGIMEQCKLGNPFQERTKFTASMQTGGDKQIEDMKALVVYWAEKYDDKEIKAKDLRQLANANNLFSWIRIDELSGMTQFSKMITRYANRIFAGYKVIVDSSRKQTAYRIVCVDEPKIIEESVDDIEFCHDGCKKITLSKEEKKERIRKEYSYE